jgi:pimeloyl-ACP methyl ester carboxylesterase
MRWLALFVLIAAAQAGPTGTVQTVLQAPGPDSALVGTMLAPKTPAAPVVLIVPGSGPVDRDGNGPGARAATYRLLAEGLAAHGIASVRIDKRGMYGSRAAIPNANAVTIEDYAADVRTWVSIIRRRTGAPCVWVLGHSEGGLVALFAAQRATDFCGLMLIAAAGRPLGAVLREQLRSNPANAPILAQAMAVIADLEAGRRVDARGMNRALLPLFRPAVQGFLISEFSLDPAALIAACHEPILIVQGRRDLQVGVRDAERLSRANPTAKLVLLPDVNHVLKTVTSDDRGENIATYGNPDLPLAPGVIRAIAGFIAASEKVR